MDTFRALCRSRLSVGLMILALIGLAACGGGGGGGGSNNGGGGGTGLTLSLSTNAITFNSVPPAFPAPVDVIATVTGTASGTLFVVVATSNPAVANVTNVIITGPTTGQGTIVPGSPAVLGAGTHTATIQVRACLNDATCATGQVGGSPRTITVTYNVTGVASSVSNLTYNIGNAPAAGDLARSFNVTGFPAQTWTITDDMPWLELTPTTGSAAAAVSVSANLAALPLDALNNGAHTGTVTLTPTTGSPVQIPVTLNVSRTQVNYVAPYVAQSGIGGEVIIRGENFLAITLTGVRFGSTDDPTAIRVSDTEIRATHGALLAGTYDVHVLNSEGVDRTRAQLKVVDVPTFAEAALTYPDGPDVILTGLVYDAERRAVFATVFYNLLGTGMASARIVRWDFTSAWNPAIQLPVPERSTSALTTDGTKLLVAHLDTTVNQFAVAEYDPVTLVQTRTTRHTQDYEATTMALSSNGEAIIIADRSLGSATYPVFGYSPLTGVLREPMQPGPFFVADGFAVASGDGSTVLVPSNNDGFAGAWTLRYDSDTRQFVRTPTLVRASVEPHLNRDGSRLLFERTDVYDSNLSLLGRLQPTTQSAVLDPTPDPSQRRAYAYDADGTVRVYDLTAAPVGGIYPEIPPAITLSNNPGIAVYQMTISPDGGTLFIGGREQVVVVPLP